MIFYLVTAAGDHTVSASLPHCGAELRARLQVMTYERLFRSARIPAGSYVFSDIERLTPHQAERAALAWRALAVARLAADAGLKFQAYLAAGFDIWIGIQAFINIGVNMGMLPTKGLTLPLMSYGRSSLVVTVAWVGILLRVHHEAASRARGPATVTT